jgi:hypothetical protein
MRVQDLVDNAGMDEVGLEKTVSVGWAMLCGVIVVALMASVALWRAGAPFSRTVSVLLMLLLSGITAIIYNGGIIRD